MAWLLLVLLLAFVLFLARKTYHRADEANRRSIEVLDRLKRLEIDLRELKSGMIVEVAEPTPAPVESQSFEAESETFTLDAAPPDIDGGEFSVQETERSSFDESADSPVEEEAATQHFPIPPDKPFRPAINWEQFFGVKLFAWAAGLALFLGVAFFLKWSFDQGIITPPVRVAMGIVAGLGMLIVGLRLPRERYAVLVQSLSSAGLLVLYADIFAACSYYHFLGHGAAFGLMSLVTFVTFLLASRLKSPAVAILGLLGGFLTPPMLSTGEDRPVGLFTYIGLLDLGLIAVALYNRWNLLALFSVAATVLMEYGWVAKFFSAEKAFTAMTVFFAFTLLYLAAALYDYRKGRACSKLSASAILASSSAMIFAMYLLVYPYPSVAAKPWLFFGLVFLVDAAWLTLAAIRKEVRPLSVVAASVTLLLLLIWTQEFLTNGLLNWALAAYLLFGVLHSVCPLLIERFRPSEKPPWWTALFAPLSLTLIMIPILNLTPLSHLVWPAVLLIDILAIGVAFLTASVLGILLVTLLTALVTLSWITEAPAQLSSLPVMLVAIGGFAVLFFVAGLSTSRKIRLPEGLHPEAGQDQNSSSHWHDVDVLQAHLMGVAIPAISALLPFLLLTMVAVRLPLQDPSPLFGLAAFMVVLLLGMVRYYRADWLGVVALAGVALLEFAWYTRLQSADNATIPLIWYLGFYAGFTLFPFLFSSDVKERTGPWLMSSLAGPVQFWFVYKLTALAYRIPYTGVVPAVFAIFSLLAVVRLVRTISPESGNRNTLLALFGGVTLFFITVVFPVQFEKEWITVGWALEGAALLWLYHRIPHVGLRYVGIALLMAAFCRLAFNLAVLGYHPRSATPILNWYLYAYGIVTLSLFAGTRLLSNPHFVIRDFSLAKGLAALGIILGFLLVNIEIADYFSTGTTLTFQFSGNFARDMTYSLAWGAFAFVVLLVGIARKIRGARLAGIGLLVATLVKLFLHDLWRLGGLYRIGSLIGLALVLIVVSFLYQRFLSPGRMTSIEEGQSA